MLVRSRRTRPPSNRSRSRRVHRSPRNPAYTVAATIAPMIPPHRAAATSTPPPSTRRSGAQCTETPCDRGPDLEAPGPPSLAERRPVDGLDLTGYRLPGVPAGGGGGRLADGGQADRVVEQAPQGGGQGLGVAGRDQQPVGAVVDHVAVAADVGADHR